MHLRSTSSDEEPGFCSDIPNAFTSLQEARNSMDWHWNTCIHLLSDIELHTKTGGDLQEFNLQQETRCMKFSIMVKKWEAAFQAFLQESGKSLDRQSLRGARTLEIIHIFCAIYSEMLNEGLLSELMWDRFTERLNHITELASLIIGPTCDDVLRKQQPKFSQDVNIVPPLYAVAHRCRDPVIRRRAVALLYAAPRQEGVWDSILTARVAENVISIEENGLGHVASAQDVPEWARISDVHVNFDLYGRLGAIQYRCLSRYDGKGREPVLQTISW